MNKPFTVVTKGFCVLILYFDILWYLQHSFFFKVEVWFSKNNIFSSIFSVFSQKKGGHIASHWYLMLGTIKQVLPFGLQLCATSVHFLCRGLQGRGTPSLVSFIFTLTSSCPLLSSMIFFSLYLARSPVFSHLSASLQGLHTIRALRVQEKFCEEFDNHQNLHTESWFLFLSSSRWLAVRLDWMCAIFITVVSFACVFLAKGLFRTWSYPWFDCYITCSQTCT